MDKIAIAVVLSFASSFAVAHDQPPYGDAGIGFEGLINGLALDAQARLGNILHVAGGTNDINPPSVLPSEITSLLSKDAVAFLAGRVYSQTVTSRPLGAPNDIQFKHMITFKDNSTFVDNANSLFGNPAGTYKYHVDGNKIIYESAPGYTTPSSESGTYILSADACTLTDEAGSVLHLEK